VWACFSFPRCACFSLTVQTFVHGISPLKNRYFLAVFSRQSAFAMVCISHYKQDVCKTVN
jgi:hypothetical protein